MRRTLARLRSCERGFTLSEMLVVIVVLAFIGMAFAAIFSSVVNHSATISESITLQTEARAALDRFASDFRQAYNGDPTFLNPTSPIENVTAGTQITFTTPDRQNPLRLRRVSYRISSGALQRADVFSHRHRRLAVGLARRRRGRALPNTRHQHHHGGAVHVLRRERQHDHDRERGHGRPARLHRADEPRPQHEVHRESDCEVRHMKPITSSRHA